MPIEIVNNHKPPTKDEVKGRLIFGSIGLVLGVAIVFFASIPMIKKAQTTKNWVQTKGHIVSTSVVVHKNGNAMINQNNHRFYDGKEDVRFRVDIIYSYRVDEKEYSSSRNHLLQNKKEGSNSLRKAYSKEQWYQKNANVLVYYNPENPKEALLQRGLRFGQILLVSSPLVILLFGIWALFSGIKNTVRPVSASASKTKTFSDNFSKPV